MRVGENKKAPRQILEVSGLNALNTFLQVPQEGRGPTGIVERPGAVVMDDPVITGSSCTVTTGF